MTTRENAPPPPGWSPEPRPNPFDPIYETPQHEVWISGVDRLWTLDEVIAEFGIDDDVALADVELDELGTE